MCFISHMSGNYGNQIDGVSKPAAAGKRKRREGGAESDEEELELIQHSSDEETDDSADLVSVSCTPVMKPVITDRSGVRGEGLLRVRERSVEMGHCDRIFRTSLVIVDFKNVKHVI